MPLPKQALYVMFGFGHACLPYPPSEKRASGWPFAPLPTPAGLAMLKPKDYEAGAEVEAPSPYGAWASLHGTAAALQVGDVLEHPDGSLRVYKYVGFEEARWILPEVRTGLESIPLATGPSSLLPQPDGLAFWKTSIMGNICLTPPQMGPTGSIAMLW